MEIKRDVEKVKFFLASDLGVAKLREQIKYGLHPRSVLAAYVAETCCDLSVHSPALMAAVLYPVDSRSEMIVNDVLETLVKQRSGLITETQAWDHHDEFLESKLGVKAPKRKAKPDS